MQPELEKLLVLQDRDQKIKLLRAQIKSLPLERKGLEDLLTANAAGLEAIKLKAKQIEVERKSLELDAGTRASSIARLKNQQYETRKNDEFQAMAHEITRYEREIREIEDKELELMEQTDTMKEAIAAEEKRTATGKEAIARQMSDMEAKKTTLEARLETLLKERADLVAGVDEDLLDRFQRLFASKGDAAIVALDHEVCTGCHMKVTTQTAVRVKGGKEILGCDQCGRILYSLQ